MDILLGPQVMGLVHSVTEENVMDSRLRSSLVRLHDIQEEPGRRGESCSLTADLTRNWPQVWY